MLLRHQLQGLRMAHSISNIHVVMIVIGVISVEQRGKDLTGIDLQKNVKKVFGDSE